MFVMPAHKNATATPTNDIGVKASRTNLLNYLKFTIDID